MTTNFYYYRINYLLLVYTIHFYTHIHRVYYETTSVCVMICMYNLVVVIIISLDGFVCVCIVLGFGSDVRFRCFCTAASPQDVRTNLLFASINSLLANFRNRTPQDQCLFLCHWTTNYDISMYTSFILIFFLYNSNSVKSVVFDLFLF